ncbi:MAG: TIGR01777 family protein [Prochlorococcus sp. SP3034]|nr:TIGR01777 family protein [Prochlorococcus sp. SP3034]|tara:strand:+ start:3225 stop:4157 length:933 start_codon:yes stop_codon:yes gene_type:complete
MRILLIGCTGFIGKELIPQLIKEKNQIYIISRKNINELKLNIPIDKINFLKIDLSKEKNWSCENLINYLRNCEGIINLAGEPIADKRWTDKQKKEIESSRVNITSYLMKNLRKHKINPKVIINGSAIGYYGTSLDKEFNENSIQGNNFLANICGNWEEAALKKPLFTRLVIFRIGIVLESDGGALGKMLPIFKIGLGGPIGDGNQWMSWIHRTDLCSLINTALKNRKFKGIYNAVSEEPVRMKRFSEVLAHSLNRPNLFPVPGFILNILLGDSANIVLEGQKVKSTNITNNIYKFKYPLLENAIYSLTKN